MNKLPQDVSESTRRRNPHLYPAVGGVAPEQRQQPAVSALEQIIQKRQKGKGSVEIYVTLISCRRRELDDDGNVAALKPLRDAIAASIGIDDGDGRIKFEYGQCEVHGEQGVIVKVENI